MAWMGLKARHVEAMILKLRPMSQSFDEISPHTRFDDLKSLKQKSYCGGMII